MRLILLGVTIRVSSPAEWEADVAGPLGPFLKSLESLPVHDLHIEPFSLEQHVLGLYAAPAAVERAECA